MRNLFLSFLLMLNVAVWSQNPAFVVYHTKGTVTKAGMAGSLKKGDKLSSKDQITVSTGAQIILICKNYQSVKLTAKGKYSAATLLNDCSKKTGTITNSYFSYVWNEFTTPHGSKESDPSHYMRNAGAVSRGCNNVETKIPIDTLYYRGGSLPLYYMTTIDEPYFSMFSEDGDTVIYKPIFHATIRFENMLARKNYKPGIYYWQITDSSGNGCEPNFLKILSDKEYAAALLDLLNDIPVVSPAETAFMKAFILEENHFIGEAFKYYREAYKLAPTNNIYKLAQARFYE